MGQAVIGGVGQQHVQSLAPGGVQKPQWQFPPRPVAGLNAEHWLKVAFEALGLGNP